MLLMLPPYRVLGISVSPARMVFGNHCDNYTGDYSISGELVSARVISNNTARIIVNSNILADVTSRHPFGNYFDGLGRPYYIVDDSNLGNYYGDMVAIGDFQYDFNVTLNVPGLYAVTVFHVLSSFGSIQLQTTSIGSSPQGWRAICSISGPTGSIFLQCTTKNLIGTPTTITLKRTGNTYSLTCGDTQTGTLTTLPHDIYAVNTWRLGTAYNGTTGFAGTLSWIMKSAHSVTYNILPGFGNCLAFNRMGGLIYSGHSDFNVLNSDPFTFCTKIYIPSAQHTTSAITFQIILQNLGSSSINITAAKPAGASYVTFSWIDGTVRTTANLYALDTWHELAFVRYGSSPSTMKLMLLVNGSPDPFVTATNGVNMYGSAGNPFYMGVDSANTNRGFFFLDDYFYIIGQALWITNYAPSTSPFNWIP